MICSTLGMVRRYYSRTVKGWPNTNTNSGPGINYLLLSSSVTDSQELSRWVVFWARWSQVHKPPPPGVCLFHFIAQRVLHPFSMFVEFHRILPTTTTHTSIISTSGSTEQVYPIGFRSFYSPVQEVKPGPDLPPAGATDQQKIGVYHTMIQYV